MSQTKPSNLVAIAIIAGLFFIFGFVTWINGALIPFMKTINELTDAQSYLVASASYISFVVMALPASYILNKIGYRSGMALGLFIMAIGALVFIPAAEARTYWVFLTGIFIQGVGMTILQTAANPYITILGPIESGAKRIAIMGIANKTAGALGSLIFGALLLSGIDEVKEKLGTVSLEEKNQLLDSMADSVFVPYLVMALVLLVLGLLIRKAPLPNVEAKPLEEANEGEDSKTSIFQFPQVVLGSMAIFSYLGVEVISGDTINLYGSTLYMENFSILTAYTMSFMGVGYIIGVSAIPRFISQSGALMISAIVGLLCIFGIIFSSIDETYISEIIWSWAGLAIIPNSVFFVAMVGLANAMVWPSISRLRLMGLENLPLKVHRCLLWG